ncbi:hypothetical protein KIPB_008037, partial [Kipferlia bialata]|eukprot:g8037.t1
MGRRSKKVKSDEEAGGNEEYPAGSVMLNERPVLMQPVMQPVMQPMSLTPPVDNSDSESEVVIQQMPAQMVPIVPTVQQQDVRQDTGFLLLVNEDGQQAVGGGVNVIRKSRRSRSKSCTCQCCQGGGSTCRLVTAIILFTICLGGLGFLALAAFYFPVSNVYGTHLTTLEDGSLDLSALSQTPTADFTL